MAKIRGSKDGSLISIKNRLEEALADPQHLVAYIKAIINSIDIEIEKNVNNKK